MLLQFYAKDSTHVHVLPMKANSKADAAGREVLSPL
jgi:hypothetical protein